MPTPQMLAGVSPDSSPDIERGETQQVLPHGKKHKYKYMVEGISKHDDEFKKPHNPKDYRKRFGHFMESHPIQIAVLVLTILDLIVIGVDLFLEEHYAKCTKEEEGHSEEAAETAEKILKWISVSILGLLGIEILLIFFAFGRKFFRHPFYVLDMVVIALSLLFEIHFKEAAGTLLVVFRLWRLIRVAHGVAMSIEEREEERIRMIQAQNVKLKSILEQWKKTYNIQEPYNIEEPIPNHHVHLPFSHPQNDTHKNQKAHSQNYPQDSNSNSQDSPPSLHDSTPSQENSPQEYNSPYKEYNSP